MSMSKRLNRRSLLLGAGAAFAGGGLAAELGGAWSWADQTGAERVGPRWALLIDQAACARRDGCRACVAACHEGHSVPDESEPPHAVKWLWKEPFDRVFPDQINPAFSQSRRQLPVLVLCNHCGNPPCASVCPTGATWRRDDGIVAMDPHRCIGCRYCMVACPYEARSFNWSTPPVANTKSDYPRRSAGVVEKCTLCAERVDLGEVPLCVEACHSRGSSALCFGDLGNPGSELRRRLEGRVALRRKPELGSEPSVYYLV